MKPITSIQLSLLTGALTLLTAGTSPATVVTLQPVDDSFISSLSGQTNTPVGNANQLVTTGWLDIGATRPLLKFDLSSIPDGAVVLSAVLTLEQVYLHPTSWPTFPVEVWRMPNDDWSEATVTWNSYVQTGAVAVAILYGKQTNSPKVWNINLADWNFTKDLLDNAVTFQLRWGDELSQHLKQVGYSSKEGAVVPSLRIEYIPRPADEITLQDDSYISTLSGQTDTPFGDANQLAVTGWSDIGRTRPLLKFDLSSIPDGSAVLSAELTLEQVALGAGSWNSFPVELWRMPNDDWSEATVTWNSYAQTGAVLVASLQSPQTNGPRVWNITIADWNYAEDLLDNAVTFQLRWGDELSQHFKQVGFSSKEGTVAPTLRIEYASPPSPVTFTTNTFAVGDENSGPDCVAFADVNGDGRLDLISANYGFRWAQPGDPGGWNTTLTVLTNNGSGGFGSNATLTVGTGPSAVVAADVNGDGHADLISANETDNTVTVLTNNGSGHFGSKGTFAVGVRPRGLVATDVNGDGTLDLVSPNAGANTLTVLTNQGRGVFGLHATLPVGNQPLFVAAADVNGDGQPDLISANKNDDSLTVLTNNGSGDFTFNATLPVGHFPNAVSAADFNGDAKLDLVSVNWGAATMTVLTNNGGGGFAFNAALGVGSYPSTVAAADFNGDGAADLICANSGADSLTVLTNNGSGVFGYDTTVATGRIPNVFAADLNSDGRTDLACPNFRDGTVTVLLNTTMFAAAGSSRALTIRSQNGRVRVAWPSASPGWSLQQQRELAAPNWLPSGHDGYPFTDDRTNKSLTLPAANAGRFFRLLHP